VRKYEYETGRFIGKPSNHKTNDQPEWYKKYEKQSQE
jgi:hypothetical protein